MPLGRARGSLEQLHTICRWLDHCYGDPDAADPPPFDFAQVPPAPAAVVQRARAELERTQTEFDDARRALAEEREHNAALQQELEALRAEAAAAKTANATVNAELGIPDPTLATEAETRRDLIDLHLREAGWALADPRDREWPVTGIPSPSGARQGRLRAVGRRRQAARRGRSQAHDEERERGTPPGGDLRRRARSATSGSGR